MTAPPATSRSWIVDSRSDFRAMVRLALPALSEEFLVLAVTWTDWWLAGHFLSADGDATKAAMGLMGYVMWLVPSLFAAVGIGATALVARFVGAGNVPMARRTTNQAFVIGAAMAIVLLGAAVVFRDPFLSGMQLRGKAAVYAREYFDIVICSIPMIMLSIVGASCLRGAGDMVTGFVTKGVVVATNIVISYSLVTGWGPVPEIGWKGLAIGTAIGHSLGGLIIAAVLFRGRVGLQIVPRLLRPEPELIGRILRIGLPGGFDIVVLLFSQMVYLAMINALGEAAAAAHGLAVQIEACCFLPGAAFYAAAATMSGQLLGARLPARATRSGWWCLAGGGSVMWTMAILLFLFGRHFAWFFTGQWEHATVVQAGELLQIISFVMPFLAVVMILTGTLRGAGDTVFPLLITAFGFFLVRIPLAALLSFSALTWFQFVGVSDVGMGWGVQGAWYAMVIDIVVRSLLVLARFVHGGWKRIMVHDD